MSIHEFPASDRAWCARIGTLAIQLASPYVLPLSIALLLSGCATPRTVTLVEGALVPGNFRFVTIVKQRGEEPGGWRSACLRLPIKSDTGDKILCQMGVDMPIRTKEDGLITLPAAQRIAANSRVKTACHPKAESAMLGR